MKNKEIIMKEIATFYENNSKSYETFFDAILDGNIDDCMELVSDMLMQIDSETMAILIYNMMKVSEALSDKIDDDETLTSKMNEITNIMEELEEQEEEEES